MAQPYELLGVRSSFLFELLLGVPSNYWWLVITKTLLFFPLHFSVPSIFRQLAPCPLGAAANCCGLSPRQWLLYAAWLRCDHWRRRSFVESKFSPVQPFTQTTGSVFIFYHIIVSREVSTIHVSEPLTDWITPLIQNETNNNRNWYSIECPKFGLQSLLYGFESNESFMFFSSNIVQFMHFGQCCNILWLFVSCLWMCLPFPRLATSAFGQALSRLSLNTILHHLYLYFHWCICIRAFVFLFLYLNFYFYLDRHCPAFLLIQFSIITWFVFVYVFLYFYLCICIFILVLEFIFVFGQALSHLYNSPS